MAEQHVAKTFRHLLFAYQAYVSECSCGWRMVALFERNVRSAAVQARKEHLEGAARER